MRFVAAGFVLGAVITGVAGAASIVGTPRADRLTGTAKPDSIDGRAGNDTLRGLAGGDFLQGGAGRDTVDGGSGDDRVAAHADGAVDRVRCGAGRDIVDAERNDVVAGDCEVVSRQLSVDTTTNPIGQHATEVEPDSYAFGWSIVSVFQVGRVFSGGAVAIGYSTSTDKGETWKAGLLPGVTASSPQPGVAERASDPSITYDAVHHTWLAATLGISPATSSFYLYVSRSGDGRTWTPPVVADLSPAGTATSTRNGSTATTGPPARSPATAIVVLPRPVGRAANGDLDGRRYLGRAGRELAGTRAARDGVQRRAAGGAA